MVSFEELTKLKEIEFSDIVESTEMMNTKLRVMLKENGFIDIWISKKLENRFGFHWEQESTGSSYRYDNFPNTKWKHVSTYPYHFHYGSQSNVKDSSQFRKDILEGFRDFMKWIRTKLTEEMGDQ